MEARLRVGCGMFHTGEPKIAVGCRVSPATSEMYNHQISSPPQQGNRGIREWWCGTTRRAAQPGPQQTSTPAASSADRLLRWLRRWRTPLLVQRDPQWNGANTEPARIASVTLAGASKLPRLELTRTGWRSRTPSPVASAGLISRNGSRSDFINLAERTGAGHRVPLILDSTRNQGQWVLVVQRLRGGVQAGTCICARPSGVWN